MKPCTTCGNDIADDAWRCQWCGSQQTGAAPRPRRKRPRIVTVDLEAGRPTVAQAMRRMESELMAARTLGARVVRLIHGYGSSGTGGRIRTAALSLLRRMQRRGLSSAFLPGDEYSELSDATRELLARHPGLEADLRTDRLNPGFTLHCASVELLTLPRWQYYPCGSCGGPGSSGGSGSWLHPKSRSQTEGCCWSMM